MTRKRSVGSMAFDAINVILLTLLALACVYPFWYLLIYSVSEPQAAAIGGVTLLPKGFTFSNYAEVFSLNNMASSAVISLLRTAAGSVLTVLSCSFFAYLVTKPMYIRKTIYRLVVVTMYLDAGLVPTFIALRQYGLFNSFLIYILPVMLSGYNVILIKTFIEQLPPALEESAMLDGAGTLQTFRHIILPLSGPILATIAVFAAVGQWNAWLDAHIYVVDRNLWPMQYILYRYLAEATALLQQAQRATSNEVMELQISPMTVRMTITAVVTFPALCIYPFMQRYFVKGIMIGAVKG